MFVENLIGNTPIVEIRRINKNPNVKGRVISVSINKYLYVTLNKRYNNQIRAAYSETEIVNHLW